LIILLWPVVRVVVLVEMLQVVVAVVQAVLELLLVFKFNPPFLTPLQ
jgi:hypothetical protein